ncbi:MAG: GNAT family N-acetyltransferase, partial [Chitinophagaceae bacterium]|nr:GNAT family N-acetyltransferase [Chitinophagaceae bacterium]
NVVKGYYTLSANSIRREDFPETMQKKLPPSYINLPATLLGRLAIDVSIKGQGYGEILLMDALYRTLRTVESVGSLAIIVDPVDEKAQRFYGKYGFILLPTSGKMFLPMKTIKDLYSQN